MKTSQRKVTWFRILRAGATPLLVVGLVAGGWVAVAAGSLLADSKPAEGPFVGFAALGVGIVAVAGFATAANCAAGLWLFWRKWRPKAVV